MISYIRKRTILYSMYMNIYRADKDRLRTNKDIPRIPRTTRLYKKENKISNYISMKELKEYIYNIDKELIKIYMKYLNHTKPKHYGDRKFSHYKKEMNTYRKQHKQYIEYWNGRYIPCKFCIYILLDWFAECIIYNIDIHDYFRHICLDNKIDTYNIQFFSRMIDTLLYTYNIYEEKKDINETLSYIRSL